jgi:hypothetical protein
VRLFRREPDVLESEAVKNLAAAAYAYIAEVENPAPDFIMRELLRKDLSLRVKELTYEERKALKAWSRG